MKTTLSWILSLALISVTPSAYSGECSWGCIALPKENQMLEKVGAHPSRSLPNEIQVFVWNIYKAKLPQFRKTFDSLRKDSDLVFLQEGILKEEFDEDFFSESNHEWSLAISFFMKDWVPTGVFTGSQSRGFDALPKRTVDREPLANTPKMTLGTKYLIADKELLAINIHGINWRGNQALKRQLEQWRQQLSDHTGPILFGGDFNTKNAERQKLTDQFMIEFGMTRIEFPGDRRKNPLDHIYQRGFQVKSSQLLFDKEASDHPALLTRLRL